MGPQYVAKDVSVLHASSIDSDQPRHLISLIRIMTPYAQYVTKDPIVLHASSKDSDQPRHPISLINGNLLINKFRLNRNCDKYGNLVWWPVYCFKKYNK